MKRIFALIMACALAVALCACSVGSVYGDADKYSHGNAEIAEKITEIEIEWSSGAVNVIQHDGDTISISETSDSKLDDDSSVYWLVDGNELKIKHTASGYTSFGNLKKTLTVAVPRNIELDEIEISAASADVSVDGFSARKVKISTASGNIAANLGDVDELKTNAASGNAKITVNSVGKAEMDAASGSVSLDANAITNECDIETASGNVELTVPESFGGTFEFDTASGKITYEIPMRMENDRYVSGDGSVKIEIETASGDIYIRAK